MSTQGGQSLVEFAAGSTALLLLLLGVITLSGYQEVQRRALGAARQLAFQSVWQRTGSSPGPLDERVFADHLDDPGLLDAVGRSRLVEEHSVQASRQFGPAPGLARDAATVLLAPLRTSRALVGGEIDLEPGGYASGDVAVQMQPRPWAPSPFRDIDLEMRQPFAILTDAWNSAGPEHVRDRTASLVPTQRLMAVASAWQALAAPLSVLEPSLDRLCLGLVEPDGVPADRLGPIVGRAPGRSRCR
jgi:hypothetical protein